MESISNLNRVWCAQTHTISDAETAVTRDDFRAGVLAEVLGTVVSVVFGGCLIFATVALWAWLFPSLRRVDNPDAVQPYGESD